MQHSIFLPMILAEMKLASKRAERLQREMEPKVRASTMLGMLLIHVD